MSFNPKKLLVILELNNILFYLNNPRTKIVTFSQSRTPVNYQDNYGNLQISIRKGKSQLLNYFFINMKNDIDVAVWSNLSNQFTNDLTHKYFTRYYRDLLFILATNRTLYGDQPPHTAISIRRDLNSIYQRFPGYNEGNTIVVTPTHNLIESHSRNDLIIPEYSPSNPEFGQDPGLIPLAKYIQGLILVKNESGINDIRRFVTAKQASNIFKRTAHNIYTQRQYK